MDKIKLNDIQTSFNAFPSSDSLIFMPVSDSIPDEPSKMLVNGEYLIIQTFCKAKDVHLVVFSLKENRIVNKVIKYGNGPDELLSCDICQTDNKLWLYDISKMQIGFAAVDSFLLGTPNVDYCKLNGNYYYRTAMLNDSIMLGTNNMNSKSKISFVNIFTGEIIGHGDYSYLNDKINLGVLIDACSCYINVNPKTKDILLSYRYTDVIEIYNSKGEIKHALQGPENFDIKFRSTKLSMGKVKETRKSFVNSYVTEDYIYLLYSGCKRTEKNWAYGSKIFVYSWEGKPIKQYNLEEPVYAFAVDEERHMVYSYSMQTEELVKAKL